MIEQCKIKESSCKKGAPRSKRDALREEKKAGAFFSHLTLEGSGCSVMLALQCTSGGERDSNVSNWAMLRALEWLHNHIFILFYRLSTMKVYLVPFAGARHNVCRK